MDINNHPARVYDTIYEKTKEPSQFSISEGLSGGKGLSGVKRGGAAGNLPKDVEGFIPRLTKLIKNPDRVTIKINGKLATPGVIISPYKSKKFFRPFRREVYLVFFIKNLDL